MFQNFKIKLIAMISFVKITFHILLSFLSPANSVIHSDLTRSLFLAL